MRCALPSAPAGGADWPRPACVPHALQPSTATAACPPPTPPTTPSAWRRPGRGPTPTTVRRGRCCEAGVRRQALKPHGHGSLTGTGPSPATPHTCPAPPCAADLRCYYICGSNPELRAGNSFTVVSRRRPPAGTPRQPLPSCPAMNRQAALHCCCSRTPFPRPRRRPPAASQPSCATAAAPSSSTPQPTTFATCPAAALPSAAQASACGALTVVRLAADEPLLAPISQLRSASHPAAQAAAAAAAAATAVSAPQSPQSCERCRPSVGAGLRPAAKQQLSC